MNIVILHAHLQRGGVTQVIENQVRSLADDAGVDRIVLMAGPRMDGISNQTRDRVVVVSVPELEYDSIAQPDGRLPDQIQRLRSAIKSQLERLRLTADDTLLHWHNHSLGKNVAVPGVIAQLADATWHQLLQIHDFAEDNRPENYVGLIRATQATSPTELDRYLYPSHARLHYATLTRADASVLRAIGNPDSRTHWLPNSVSLPTGRMPDRDEALGRVRAAMGLPDDAGWMLYPVRGIRRKNVGEFLLLSRWMPPGVHTGLTLEPTTPIERASYRRWKMLAQRLAPRAVFDAGHHPSVSFADNLAAADGVISTSVAEGFGMTFLEPWLAGREVIARRLPTVADDFAAAGVRMEKAYDRLPIPSPSTNHRGTILSSQSWLDQCRAEIDLAHQSAWSDVPPAFRPAPSTHHSLDPTIDFGKLTCHRQIEVLDAIDRDPGYASAVSQSCQAVVAAIGSPPSPSVIDDNARVIADQYSVERAGKRLIEVYQRLLRGSDAVAISQPSNPSNPLIVSVVNEVNRVRPFYPCRTEVLSQESTGQ